MITSFSKPHHFMRATLFLLISLVANSAQASFLTTYSIKVEPFLTVTDIAFWEKGDQLESLAGMYTAYGFTTTEIKSLYPKPPYPYASFMLGLVSDLPNDPTSGLDHVVLMMSDEAATRTLGLTWSEMFPNTDENELITAIKNLDSDDFDTGVAASMFIFSFIGDVVGAGYTPPDPDTPQPTIPYYFAPGDSFKIVAFSTSQKIGSGTSSVTNIGAVPEPSSAALLAGGVASLVGLSRGYARRRRPSSLDSSN